MLKAAPDGRQNCSERPDILVISVRGREDRRDRMRREMGNLAFDFIDAVTPDSQDYRDYISAEPKIYGTPHPVEICCTLSHQKAFRLIAERGRPAIILEDDVSLRPGFARLAADCQGMEDLMIYHLGGLEGLVEGELLITRRGRPPIMAGSTEFRKVIAEPWYLMRTCGYALTPETARAMTRGFAQKFHTADHWWIWTESAGLKALLFCPLVRHPRFVGASSIELGRMQARGDSWFSRQVLPVIFRSNLLFNTLKTGKHILRRFSPWYIRGMIMKHRMQLSRR